MSVTIVDIARAAGVGEATVVRALRGTGYVSPATKARVKKIAAEMNYRPNHIARSLALGKSDFIGIVAGSSVVAAFQPFIEPIEQGIREAGYSLLFYISTSNRPDAEQGCFEELVNKRVAGAIVVPGSLTADPKPYQMLISNGVKLVIMDRSVEEVETPQIVVDHYASARIATEHLISLGHRQIVYLAIPEVSQIGRERARGFRDAMNAAGIAITKASIVETEGTEEAGFRATVALLKRKVRPTAVLARHDVVAIGVMQAVFAAGLSMPEDISLIGHGDHGPCYALRVPLTTVHAPTQQMASLAVEKLLDSLAGKPVKPVTTALDVELIVRSSTAPPPSKR